MRKIQNNKTGRDSWKIQHSGICPKKIKERAKGNYKSSPYSIFDEFRTPACGVAFAYGIGLGFCVAVATITFLMGSHGR